MVQIVRNIVFLFLIIMAGAVALKHDFGNSRSRATAPATRGQLMQNTQTAARPQSYTDRLVLEPSSNGHYFVIAEIRGEEVQFLIDTGASSVALTPEDAARIGFEPSSLEYTDAFQTANGIARFAPVVLDQVRLDGIEINDVRASVSQGQMGVSLLGMSFLKRLNGYQVENGNLILYW